MRMRAAGPPGKMSPVNRIGKKKLRNHLREELGARGYNEQKINEDGNSGAGENGKIGVCCRCNKIRLVGPLKFPAEKRWCVGGCGKTKKKKK